MSSRYTPVFVASTLKYAAGRVALLSGIVLLPFVAQVAMAQEGAPPPAVIVQTVERVRVSAPMTFSGTVNAIDSVDIMARVQGFLETTEFDAADAVETGDVLFTIESAPYDATVSVAKAKVAQAQAQLKNASQELERQRTLVDKNVATEAKLEQVQAQASIAQADVEAAEAQLEGALIDQGYTTVRAPFGGEISQANFSHGALVGPQSGPLARLVRLDPLHVVFSIPDAFLVDLRQNQADADAPEAAELDFRLRLPNGQDYAGKGKVDYIASETDTSTGTVPVRLTFDNPDRILIPGQFVNVMIAESDPPKMPVVPQTAILQDRDGRYVFVLNDDDTVSERRIEIGPKVDGGRGVTDGLKEGERVVTQGVQKIADGAKVQASGAANAPDGGSKSTSPEQN